MRIRFEPSGREIEVAIGTTLFDAAQAAGLPVGTSCGADGTCGRCGLRVIGDPTGLTPPNDHELRVVADNRVDPSLRLSCLAQVIGEVVATADYW